MSNAETSLKARRVCVHCVVYSILVCTIGNWQSKSRAILGADYLNEV